MLIHPNLVTGGAGFIGSCYVRSCLADGLSVVNFDLLTYAGNLDSLESCRKAAGHVFVRGDVADGDLLREVFAEHRPRYVVHFAAESHVDRSIDDAESFVRTNVVGTYTLLEAALKYYRDLPTDEQERFRFLHVSTDEVYGSLGDEGRFTEDSPYDPSSPYSASKAAADHFARVYHRTHGLPVIVTNCSNNYGPFQFPEKLIPLVTLNALEGKPLPVYGAGQNVRDWLYVEDHCEALRTVLESGRIGATYNIGGDEERTNLQVVEAICDVVDALAPDLPHSPCRQLIEFVTDRPGHDHRYAIDAARIRNELGWRPKNDFESGLRKTIQWYLDNREWVDRITSGVLYQRERLGAGKCD
jgi:dTDP-glucose 4,6-dehydratase